MKSSTSTIDASSESAPSAFKAIRKVLRKALELDWRTIGIAIALGLTSAFAFPPNYAMPILWLVYPLLLWQLNRATTHRKACLIGWAFGFGQFVLSFYWISVSMFTDIAHWWWAVPFASTILPILLGFIPGFAIMLWWRMRLIGVQRILAFAAWMNIGEWFRGHFLTGFPWNLTAHGWIGWLPLLQSYSFLGAYGLGLITIFAASLPSLFTIEDYPGRRAGFYTFGALGVIALLAAWGVWRYSPLSHGRGREAYGAAISRTGEGVPQPESLPQLTPAPQSSPMREEETTAQPTIVRLIQPNVPQGLKWSSGLSQEHFTSLIELSEKKADGPPLTVFIWPETAVPYLLDLSSELPHAIGSVAPRGGTVLAGVLRRERVGDDWHYYNSLDVIAADGKILGTYDKTHLAPFGEYMPFRSVLPLDALAAGASDLDAGTGPKTLSAPNLPSFSPLICYEAIFPEQIIDPSHRPQWLLQVTNDGWFGNSWGPYQHFAMARVRAVEQGLPLLRAANTGISGAVDAYGRVLASLPIGVQGTLDVALPPALPHAPFYARYGDLLFFLMIGATLLFVHIFPQRQVDIFT